MADGQIQGSISVRKAAEDQRGKRGEEVGGWGLKAY